MSELGETIATADRSGRRIWVYPADVKGRYRTWRTRVQWVLLAVFLALPWMRIGGHPALLLDFPGRRFSILGHAFWAHDAPLLLFILFGFAVALALVTALWGRIWCGWACPQTVFIDAIYRRIERWVEGDGVRRKRLDSEPWSLRKARIKAVKWGLFALVSIVVGNVFLAYFVGSDELARMMRLSPAENPGPFLTMLGAAGFTLFEFGWFREQFCTLVCPYGRFQSVLMDDRSWGMVYDSKRSDCIDCLRCVKVCPTGIDIRKGLQMECIACAACADACDEVMRRIRRPEKLIRFASQNPQAGGARVRVWAYGILLAAIAGGLALAISARRPIEGGIVRAIGTPYEMVPEAAGSVVPRVVNHFKVDLRNQSFEEREVRLELDPAFSALGGELVIASGTVFRVPPGTCVRVDAFVRFPKTALVMGKTGTTVAFVSGPERVSQEVRLVGPF